MIKQDVKDTMLVNNNIKWALVGSTNLQLQGMQIEPPRDLDTIEKGR